MAFKHPACRLFGDVVDLNLALREARQHIPREHFDTLDRLFMGEEARAANDVEMAEGASLALEFHDLAVDGVGVASEKDALRYSLLAVIEMSAAAFWEADFVTPFSGWCGGESIFLASPVSATLGLLR